MLEKLNNLPDHVFAVKATGEVTKDDLQNILIPGLQELVDRTGEIYYLLLLNTDVQNFTAGAWVQDVIAGIKHFSRWKKMAIVTDQKAVAQFTDLFSVVSPGTAKGYAIAELPQAITWVSGKEK